MNFVMKRTPRITAIGRMKHTKVIMRRTTRIPAINFIMNNEEDSQNHRDSCEDKTHDRDNEEDIQNHSEIEIKVKQHDNVPGKTSIST